MLNFCAMRNRLNIVAVIIAMLLPAGTVSAMEKADLVVVEKSKSALYLKRSGKILKKYRIALGPQPKGPKRREGDGRTPEGFYILDLKNPYSAFYKSIRISYPNGADMEKAAQLGVSPGGAIMIHGQKNGWEKMAALTQRRNWTKGCLAVTNQEMDEIWEAVDIGTPIEIRP
jgi:murein L,D-transpeptidase YafK